MRTTVSLGCKQKAAALAVKQHLILISPGFHSHVSSLFEQALFPVDFPSPSAKSEKPKGSPSDHVF